MLLAGLPAHPCFSLLSPFFSLFRGDSGLENPPKTVCFQPSHAEQEHNVRQAKLARSSRWKSGAGKG
jgi:hypothetical protein